MPPFGDPGEYGIAKLIIGKLIFHPNIEGFSGFHPTEFHSQVLAFQYMGGVFIRDVAEWTVVMGLPVSILEHFFNPTVARQVFVEPSAFSKGLSFLGFVGGIPVSLFQCVFIQAM